MLSALSLWKRPINAPGLKSLKPFFPLAWARESTSIKVNSMDSRLVTGPSNILFAGVHVCTFQPGKFTGWGSERVKRGQRMWEWQRMKNKRLQGGHNLRAVRGKVKTCFERSSWSAVSGKLRLDKFNGIHWAFVFCWAMRCCCWGCFFNPKSIRSTSISLLLFVCF